MRQDNFQIDKNRKNLELGVKMDSFLKRATSAHFWLFSAKFHTVFRKLEYREKIPTPTCKSLQKSWRSRCETLLMTRWRNNQGRYRLIGISGDVHAWHMELPVQCILMSFVAITLD